MTGLTIENIHKSFVRLDSGRGTMPALRGVSFQAQAGQITAVLGPSGCGKSTLLNIIAGLETPDQGDVLWDNVSLNHTPPYQRQFGLMFQDFALFPHKNVFENIAFGLKMGRQPQASVQPRVEEVLQLVGLPGFEKRDVNQLSGGEQQRIALARALAPRPRLLMLDEPLGALDRLLRERLVDDLRQILHNSAQTALYVTHDQEEAFALADQVVVMHGGRVEQIGSPEQIYHHPASLFVAQFLGMSNLLPGVIQSVPGKPGWFVGTNFGLWPLTGYTGNLKPGPATVLIRPNTVELGTSQAIRLQGVIRQRSFRGRNCRILFESMGIPLTFELPCSEDVPAENEIIQVSLDPGKAIVVFQ